MKSIAVFCGSNFGRGEGYRAAAAAFGRTLAGRGLRLVYGGTNRGLMGVVADAVLAGGGAVTGVITHSLHQRGHLHPGVAEFEVVADMRSRKARMAECADAFIALPGGIGTLEELFEIWTLAQIEGLTKPIGMLDVGGFYQPLLGFIEHMIEQQFLPAAHRGMVAVDGDPERLLALLDAFRPVGVPKWL
ncbi:MAG TPA: TIGR00730 family Rossman fold protein [Burkholderiales bacterium]|nr:TIGR00730 family Rossman fold protein [Burkholderiales bacterium]